MKKLLLILFFPFSTLAQSFNVEIGDSSQLNLMEGIIKLSDNGYLAFGRMKLNSWTERHPTIVKLASNGNVLWIKGIEVTGQNMFFIRAAVELPTGELMLYANYSDTFNYTGYSIIKTSSAGNILWSKKMEYQNFVSRDANNMLLLKDGNLLLSTKIGSLASIYGEQVLYKIDTAGNMFWNSGFNMFSGGDDYLNNVVQGKDNNFYLIGSRSHSAGGNHYPVFSKIDSLGNVLWSKEYQINVVPTTMPYFNDLLVLPSGNFLVAGKLVTSPATNTALLCELDSSGSVVWQKQFSVQNESLVAYSAAIDDSGRIYVNGLVKDNAFRMITDSTGNPISAKRILGTYTRALHSYLNATHNPELLAILKIYGFNYIWKIIKTDDIDPICDEEPLAVMPYTQDTMISSIANLSTYVNNMNLVITSHETYSGNPAFSSCTPVHIIEPDAADNLRVYPNPAGNILSIETGDDYSKGWVYITDATGRKVYHGDFTGALKVETTGLEPGVYFISVQQINSLRRATFVVRH